MEYVRSEETTTLTFRLEKLERENRILKRGGIAAFVAIGAVVAMGQAPSRRTVTADEFVLRDSAGVMRASLGFQRNEPALLLFNSNGQEMASVMPEAISFRDPSDPRFDGATVLLGSSSAISYQVVEGKTQVLDSGPGLMLFGKNKEVVDLRASARGTMLSLSQHAVLKSGSDGPSLTLSDTKGFRSVVGSVSFSLPSTGETSKTSAASIALFDKDGRSI